ncbi:MAG: YfhO family protein [Lachnospiraceae bacterium]|nr:YfhO family protein [Lachnospiraceae bacterium]
MENGELGRITRELEDLLMNKNANPMGAEAAAAEEEQPEKVLAEEKSAEVPEEKKMELWLEAAELRSEWTGYHRNKEQPQREQRLNAAQTARRVRSCDGLIAAFLVPVVIMIIIFVQRGIFPFGEESFLRTDMYHQYAPFFSEFQDKLKHGGSLLYSWDVGMGVNFAALYAYYLASPLNWLLILCPSGLVIEFMTYSIVLKIGLSGLTMAYYLRKHCQTCDFGIAFFGIFYALSGYMAAYSWNIMWLDCILLFPLIVLGLERLVHEGKGLLYCVTLGLSIFSNYYISIMTCIFMVLYFIALLILEQELSWEKFVSRTFQFTVYSLLAGGLAAVVLLPEIYALQATASGNFNFPKTFTQYFPIFDMIARHIGNVETEIGLDHWPNIYCGVAVLMLMSLYFSQRRIRGKEKAVYGVLLLLFFASFSMNMLNFIWHGFHYPNSLPCRQSFIYIFLVLLMSYQAYMHLKEVPWSHILKAFWGAVGFVVLAQKLVTQEHFHFIVYYVAILFLGLYLGGIWLYRKGSGRYGAALLYTLAIVSIEAAVNTTVTSVTTTSRTDYMRDNVAVEKLAESVEPGHTFYRMEKVSRKTKNDGAWMHFPSVSLFSSTANADLSQLFKKLGCESSTNAYSITGSTPLIDMLFAVKYGIYSDAPEETDMRKFLAQEEDTLLYENNYTLPLGFWVEPDFEERWQLDVGNPADVQNSLADAVGAGPVLELVMDASAEGKSIRFYPEVSGEYYVYVTNKKIEKVITKTWKGTKTYDNVDRGYLLELGYCLAGEEVTLEVDNAQNTLWADIYRFSETELAVVYERLARTPWELVSWTDTGLKGTISCQESGLMFTTIPYDPGWTILVDGVEQPAVKMLDAFIGVRLTPGSHTVQMVYHPQGLSQGAWITGISVVVLLLIVTGGWIWKRKMKYKI